MEKPETLEEVNSSLGEHTGSLGYYSVRDTDNIVITSGVLDFIAKTGAVWIMELLNTDAVSNQLHEYMKSTGMIVVKIHSEKDNVRLVVEDGNYNVLQTIYTEEDILPGEFSFWIEHGQNELVVLLPSEH
jgi:hypothetical protein